MNKELQKKHIFISVLLAMFFICQTILLVHSFSHKINSDEIGFSEVENNFLENAFFFHDEHEEGNSEDENCSLLSLLNSQKQILFCPTLFVAIAVFYLSFVKRNFSKIKLSYLLSSYFGRAPPQISL